MARTLFDYEIIEQKLAEIRKEIAAGDSSRLEELRSLNRDWHTAKDAHQKLMRHVTREIDSGTRNPLPVGRYVKVNAIRRKNGLIDIYGIR